MDLQNPKNILVVQIGKIGDMILTTPLFSELKRLFPQSQLIVFASQINKDIPLNHSSVDEVIIYRKTLLKNIMLLNSSLKRIDVWIDTKDNYSKTSGFLVKLFKPFLSMGFNSSDKNIFNVSLKEFVGGNHAIDINLSPVNYFEKKIIRRALRPSFNIPKDAVKKFKSSSQISHKIKILINISAGNESRYLEKEKWAEVIVNINKQIESAFTLIGLKKDEEDIKYILNQLSKLNADYILPADIGEVAAIIRRNDLVLSSDTSIVHVCSMLNIPIVALYPNVKWNLEKFSPLSEYHEVIVSKREGSVADISVKEISEGVMKLYEKIKSGNAESRTRVRKEDH